MGNAFNELTNEINKFNDVLNTMSILIWDSRTKMPKKGASSRGYQVGTLTSVAREILLSSKMRKLLDESENETHNLEEDSFERKTILRKTINHKKRKKGKSKSPNEKTIKV